MVSAVFPGQGGREIWFSYIFGYVPGGEQLLFGGVSTFLVGLFLLVGFVLLIWGAHLLLGGSVGIARRFGLSDLVIGVTLVAFGTSAPELFVSLSASFKGDGGIALGNVVGSNICNTLLVLGCGALFVPYVVKRKSHLPQAMIALGATVLLLCLTWLDGVLSPGEGLALLLILVIWIIGSIKYGREKTEIPETDRHMSVPKGATLLLLGLVVLWFGSEVTVAATKKLALDMGVDNRVVAAGVVALGTSLPELVTTIIAALRKTQDLGVGNVIGSNIFNLLCVLGAASIASPQALQVDSNVLIDMQLVAGTSLLLLLPIFFCRRIGRRWAIVALVFYVCYITFLVTSGRT